MKLNQLIVLFLSVFTLTVSSGCTSSQTEGDPSTAAVGDDSMEMAEAVDNNDDLSMDFDGGQDAFADLGDDFSDASNPSDLALSDETLSSPTVEEAPVLEGDDLSEVPLADSAAPSEAPLDEMAPDFGAPSDSTALADNGTAMDSGEAIESAEPDFGASTDFSDSTFESTPEPLTDTDSYAQTESTPEPATEVAPTYVPLRKMIDHPYSHNGKPVNALYMAREGDTLQSISQKIFGGDRVSELCSINAVNCGRSIKVGDKYYYNSPQRPDDNDLVKTFYEDAGIPAQTYTTQEGDNIRDLGNTLLGNRRSWMELWATNPDVESKGDLAAGISLRYWPSSDVSMPTLAQTETVAPVEQTPAVEETAMPPSPPAVEEALPTDDLAMNDIPPAPDLNNAAPPTDDFAQNDMNNNDADAATAAGAGMGSMDNIEPPPPPPPPPPMAQNNTMNNNMAATGVDDPNQTMALGVGAILLLAGVALFIAIRKRRARRPVDFNTTTQTQIE